MENDLVKRLRQGGTYQHDTVPMQKAADRIEKDAQHIDEMYGLVAAMNADHLTNKTRIEQLEAANLKAALIKVDDELRIEKLEAALRQIIQEDALTGKTVFVGDFGKIARTALEGKYG